MNSFSKFHKLLVPKMRLTVLLTENKREKTPEMKSVHPEILCWLYYFYWQPVTHGHILLRIFRWHYLRKLPSDMQFVSSYPAWIFYPSYNSKEKVYGSGVHIGSIHFNRIDMYNYHIFVEVMPIYIYEIWMISSLSMVSHYSNKNIVSNYISNIVVLRKF